MSDGLTDAELYLAATTLRLVELGSFASRLTPSEMMRFAAIIATMPYHEIAHLRHGAAINFDEGNDNDSGTSDDMSSTSAGLPSDTAPSDKSDNVAGASDDMDCEQKDNSTGNGSHAVGNTDFDLVATVVLDLALERALKGMGTGSGQPPP